VNEQVFRFAQPDNHEQRIKMQVDLSGKVAIVTGGARDIGAGIVRALAKSGASVVVNYRSSADKANALVAEVTAAGGKAVAVQADVTKGDQVRRLVDEAKAAFGGRVDILVNNAGGIVKRTKLEDMTEAFWDEVFALNTKSTFLVTQAVVPLMTNGGAIVNMASLAARDGGGGGALAYSASKGAVLTMTRGLAKELGPKKIRVNCVSPGMIDTTFHDVHTPPAAREATVAKTLVGRQGTSDDVANAVLFLASDMSAYLTGESVEINGGLYFV
jgi:3-oxoacyl-[acyl-carrier protein] reductase